MVRLDQREKIAFGVGVIAALFATAAMVVIRLLSGVPSLPEVLAELILALLPPQVFASVLDALGHAAKPLLYLCIAIGQLLVGGALGVLYARSRPGWWSGISIAAGLWAVFAVVVFPIAGYGPLASGLRGGPVLTLIILPACFLIYAIYLVLGARAAVADDRPWMAAEATPERLRLARRSFLALAGVGAAGFAVGLGGWFATSGGRSRPDASSDGVASAPAATAASPAPTAASASGQPTAAAGASPTPSAVGFNVPGLSPEITPNDQHYLVSKNLVDPEVDKTGWTLVVDGLVDKTLTFRYADLTALPQVSNVYTLMCISNEVGGDLMGTARWTGVRLRDLIEKAGPKSGIVDVELRAEDDYVDSIPFERAMHPDNLVALKMNGDVLPYGHGYPARLLVPGIYGMKNVKWLNRVTLVNSDVKGFWQQRGWSDLAVYNTASRIDVPKNGGSVTTGLAVTAGVAFAGDRGIKRVEVSFDGGKTWQEARLKSPLSPYSWVLWVAPWQAAASGGGTITVRATDGAGAVQIAEPHDTLPNGSTGYHTIAFQIG